MKRRDFIKAIGGVSTSLFLKPFSGFASNMENLKSNVDHCLALEDDNIRRTSAPSSKPMMWLEDIPVKIFAKNNNQYIRGALLDYAIENDGFIVSGDSIDLITLTYYIAVIECNTAGLQTLDDYWRFMEGIGWDDNDGFKPIDYYIKYLDQREDATLPFMLFGESRKFPELSRISRPKNGKVFWYDLNDKESISAIIAKIKELHIDYCHANGLKTGEKEILI